MLQNKKLINIIQHNYEISLARLNVSSLYNIYQFFFNFAFFHSNFCPLIPFPNSVP